MREIWKVYITVTVVILVVGVVNIVIAFRSGLFKGSKSSNGGSTDDLSDKDISDEGSKALILTNTMRLQMGKDYVVQNPKFLRPEELPYLKGDSTKIRTELGWKPTYTFKSMMEEMVDYWLDHFKYNTKTNDENSVYF